MTARTVTLVMLLTSGCALFGVGGNKDKAPKKATSEQLDKLHKLGGDQLVADYKLVEGLDPEAKTGEYQLTQCMSHYLLGHKHENEGNAVAARGNWLTCAKMCEAAAKRDGGRYRDFTTRYIEDCGSRRNAVEGSQHLARAETKIEEFRAAKGALNWYYRDMEVRGAFKQAAEALGDDNAELAALRDQYDDAKRDREPDLQRAKDFMARDDIKALNRRRDDLRAQVAGLEQDAQYSETAKVLLQQRKRDLADADREFTTLWDEAKG